MESFDVWGELSVQFQDFCSSSAVPCLDLTGRLQQAVRQGRMPYARTDGHWSPEGHAIVAAELQRLVDAMTHYVPLGDQVVKQAWRRVIEKESVPHEKKLFSIFEPHTELLKRGKAGKEIEFGHMVQIEQVQSKFITGYEVFEKRPVEHELVEPALEHHKKLFGCCPKELAADKGFYRDMDQLKDLEQRIQVVSICKKGSRTEAEAERERDPAFRHAQRFRAGVEGSISFLKRVLGLTRCYAKSFAHYTATVGATILAHNLLILARD